MAINGAANQTRAAGLARLVRNLEEKGFKVRVNSKGQKADYSKSMFKLVGKYIIRTTDGKVIDTAA